MNAPDSRRSASRSSATAAAAAARSPPRCCSRSWARPARPCSRRRCWSAIETSDDAAVYRLNERQAIVATTDFFMPIVDDPHDFGMIAATNAISDVYAMGGTPLFALAIVGMPIDKLPVDTIRRILDGGEAVCAKRGHPHRRRPHDRLGGADLRARRHRASSTRQNLKRNGGAQPGDRLVLGKPLGVGVYSAALKKEQLSPRGLRGDARQHDPAEHAGHRVRRDACRACADRRHRFRAPGPPARDLPRVGRRRDGRIRARAAASRRARARRRRHGHRSVGAQLGRLRGRRHAERPREPGRTRAPHRSADLRRPARRVRAATPSTTCSPSSAIEGFADAAAIGSITAGAPRVRVD